MQSLVGSKTEHQFLHPQIGGNALSVRHGRDESRGRQNFETLIDAGQKCRRNDLTLDCAELHAFSLSRDRAQLARGIDFGLDAPARILLDRGSTVPGVLVQSVVERRKRYLHHIGFVLRRACAECHCQRYHESAAGGCCPCHESPSREEHIELLSVYRVTGTATVSDNLPNR
jgi:hypothetical protein